MVTGIGGEVLAEASHGDRDQLRIGTEGNPNDPFLAGGDESFPISQSDLDTNPKLLGAESRPGSPSRILVAMVVRPRKSFFPRASE
jgi:hypothetical protein